MKKIDINSKGLFDLDCDFLGEELKQKTVNCIQAQKAAVEKDMSIFTPNHKALENVSEHALNEVLSKNIDVHGVATDSSISNVIMFGAKHIKSSVNDMQVGVERKQVDKIIKEKVLDIFYCDDNFEGKELNIVSSGHFWYPKDSFMAWHTNSQVPGWRIYINYVEEEGKSFFRYQRENKDIITLTDKRWNLRVFRITDEEPLWHCVYSNTNRFSLGYMLKIQDKPNLLSIIKNKVSRLL